MGEKEGNALDMDALDRAVNAAKARKDAKAKAGTATGKPVGQGTIEAAAAEAAPPRKRVTDEEKAARLAAAESAKAERTAAREASKAAKLAERAANKQAPHLRKVMKAAERLGPLGQAAELLFNEATANLTAQELTTLANHIVHHNRVRATERALGWRPQVNDTVEIVGGDPRFVGKRGKVTRSQRIRCYVEVEGASKPVYLFTSECAPIAAQPATATA